MTVESRNVFRNLDSTASDENFVFDGTNSDIAKQLYIRHQAGDTVDQVSLNSVPTAVTDRLGDLNIKFEDLPGLVQRAVLWDTGFGISPDNDAIQIWTMNNYTMANIAIPQNDVSEAGCTFKKCMQPNSVAAYYTLICSGDQMLSVSRCVIDKFKYEGAVDYLGAMWAKGGNSTLTPQIRLRDHSWTDPVSNESYSVYAVHTVPNALEASWNQCPDSGYAALAVPCHRSDSISDEVKAAMRTPTGSDWVTTWLKDEFAVDNSNSLRLILIISGVVLVLILLAFDRKKQSKLLLGTLSTRLIISLDGHPNQGNLRQLLRDSLANLLSSAS
ncbi:TKL/DRK protein kinase [Phytophthora palmivora]|uniref:TKL/DRK protein kinase n=1 Tax=Phytophthora palmivora TaxID=4796 RepID=A0A2P4XYF2_9STRA|nr:TKL/DRK protein kinase [Phytophthora palmivora]